tara:strand:- start:2105 stop:3022 length:918 start_codon:yes stop_codon:yes gene_type:complete
MQFATQISTLTDKNSAIEKRREAERNLSAQIDRALRIVEDENESSCNLCFLWRRLRGTHTIGNLRTAAVDGDVKTTVTNSSANRSSFFGSKKKKSNPSTKLQEAAAAMNERIRALEYRAVDSKREAKELMQQGQKQAALRALKKAKGLEKQVSQNQAALDAVEQQVDLIAQAEMQRHVTAALSTSSKDLKGNKEMLKKAETAIDDATEARDMAEDLGSVMNDFAAGTSNDIGDDDLLAELNELMAVVDPPKPPTVLEDTQREAARALEDRHTAWEEAEKVRRAFPTVSKGKAKVEEKEQLIASAT